MKYKLDEKEIFLMQKVREKTITDYGIDNEGYIEIEDLICAIENLYREADSYEEKYNELEKDMERYYELKSEWRD